MNKLVSLFKKLVSLFDVHIPENIDLNPVYDFLADYKPDIVILPGDFMDLDYLSHWSQHRIEYFLEDKPIAEYQSDIAKANEILDRIDKTCGPGAAKDYLCGNHEYRLEMLLQKFPDKKGVITQTYDFRRDLHLADRGYKWHGYNQVVRYGMLYFIHGVYTNKYHAEKMLRVYHKNMRYGHTHDIQVFSEVTPIGYHERKSMSCGCLTHQNHEYMKGRPNKWQNALYYAIINNDGTFNEYLCNFVHGKSFRAEGKEYK